MNKAARRPRKAATQRTQQPARSEWASLDRTLRERWLALRAEIRDTLLRTDSEQYAQIAGQVHDAEDEAVADLLVDVNLAEVDRDLAELREIEAALQRLATGRYGICERCRERIARERLEAQPAASRCAPCQAQFERARGTATPPTL
jgi:RNA polymerase-binding transcription factor DksA